MNRLLYWFHGVDQDTFCAAQLALERSNRHLSRNPAVFDEAIATGEQAIAAGDPRSLRGALFNIWSDQVWMGDGIGAGDRASLIRA